MQHHPNFKPLLAYSASAGSGKTFALAVRYISLLFMGESPSTILAATFTKKAAAEMRQRVLDSLRNLECNQAFLEAIMVETSLSREVLLSRQAEVLRRFLTSSSYIVTLDSFFTTILRSASLELGLEPDFVTKEQGNERLEAYFLEEVERHHLLAPLIRLAMAIEDRRFGKIFDLMQHFYKIDPLLPPSPQPHIDLKAQEHLCETTRHALIQALQKASANPREIDLFAKPSLKALLTKSVLAKESLGEHSWFKKVANAESEAYFDQLKEALRLWAEAKEAIVLEHLFRLYAYYRNAIIMTAKVSRVLSFDDLSYFTYRLLYESISREFLYFKIDSKFQHILLDEFQDTSTLQFRLLKPLIDEIVSGHGQSSFKSFFYVGDTKQSLYRFRGGVEELFDKVASSYGIEVKQMDTNYRSASHIVDAVNHWFRDPVMPAYLPQKSHQGASEGFVEVLESEALIADAIMQVKRLLAVGIDVDDIALLVSTNKEGQSLQEACEREGIAVLLKTSSSLKHIPKIASLVAMISYLFYGEPIDAHAMFQQIGDSLGSIELSWFSPFSTPLEVIDRLVREFGYFDNDLNILKLLAFASNYHDIPTFLEEFADSSISVASNTLHGAKIMTIHSSKGLEFEYVILLDKLTKKSPDRSLLLYEYDEHLFVDRIFYRTAGREAIDPTYARVLQSRKIASDKDSLNLLYVALTRAVEGLIVLKKSKDSIFDRLGMDLMVRGRPQSRSTTPTTPHATPPAPITLTHYGTQETPSHEEDERDYDAILFGTALHYTLEMLEQFTPESLPHAITALQNRYGSRLTSESITQIQQRIEVLLSHDAFIALLAGASIRKEQALAFDGELKQVDLLLEYRDHTLVIDYKSSKKYAIKHQNQVAYYKKAIQSITTKPTQGIVLYLLEEGVEMVAV